jgi:hypothetical protein
MAAGVPQCSVCVPILYSQYINGAPAVTATYLALFADDTCIYATENHKRPVLCNLQRGLTAVTSLYERWNMKISERNAQAIYFSRGLRVPDDLLELNE